MHNAFNDEGLGLRGGGQKGHIQEGFGRERGKSVQGETDVGREKMGMSVPCRKGKKTHRDPAKRRAQTKPPQNSLAREQDIFIEAKRPAKDRCGKMPEGHQCEGERKG